MYKPDFEQLDKLTEDGYLRRVVSPCENYVIFNYTDKTTFERTWNEHTLNSRGTVYEIATGRVVARALSKFFNFTELPEYTQQDIVNGDGIFQKSSMKVYDKADGCFEYNTRLNLWDGGTIKIGKVVNNKLTPTLIGMDKEGNLVPTKITNWHKNGKKDKWLRITLDCPPSKLSGCNGTNNMKITINHEIFVNNEWILAMDAKVGDIMYTYEDVICDNTKKHIYDMLLGDGSISKGGRNSYTFRNTCKKDHEEFLDIRKELLGEFFSCKYERISGYGTEMVDINTKCLKSIKNIRDEWYPEGKKVVPLDLDWMDELSLAIWYMEDGSLSHNKLQRDRAIFSTHGFKKEDIKRLAERIKKICKSDISYGITHSKGYYLRLNSGKNQEIQSFWKAIRRYVPQCMQYKLPEEHRGFYDFKPIRGKIKRIKKEVKILKIEELESTSKNFPHGRQGFDISTETTNYFAQGVLVHNSLGIVGYYGGKWRVTTRGSFTSDQAIKATEMLENYDLSKLNKKYTYITEIIYPENKIIVDYGDQEKLVHLTTFDTASGLEVDVESPFEPCEVIEGKSIEELLELQKTIPKDCEGFIVKFPTNFRVKIKGYEYLKIARILKGCSPLALWEQLDLFGRVSQEFKESIPEEIYPEVEPVLVEIEKRYHDVMVEIYKDAKYVIETVEIDELGEVSGEDRKSVGLLLKEEKLEHEGAIFPYILQNQSALNKYIKNKIKPKGNVL